jgi:hypothetical protein
MSEQGVPVRLGGTDDQGPGSSVPVVRIVGFNMPFLNLVGFFIKAARAAVPAAIIVAIIYAVLAAAVGALYGGMFGHHRWGV